MYPLKIECSCNIGVIRHIFIILSTMYSDEKPKVSTMCIFSLLPQSFIFSFWLLLTVVDLIGVPKIYNNFWQGGGLRSESWRSKVDNLLITIATESCKEGWVSDESKTFLPNESTLTCSDLQLAALHALLASLLSPSGVRPPHLAPALELFRRGKSCQIYRNSIFSHHPVNSIWGWLHGIAVILNYFFKWYVYYLVLKLFQDKLAVWSGMTALSFFYSKPLPSPLSLYTEFCSNLFLLVSR